MYLCYFFSYLYKYLNRYWANQLHIFIITSTKKAIFIAMHLKKHIWHTTISKIIHPSLSKNKKGPMQIKRSKCYSLMLLCLKINCINITKKSPYHPQAGRHRALFQIYLHVILLMSAIYFRVIIMVGF